MQYFLHIWKKLKPFWLKFWREGSLLSNTIDTVYTDISYIPELPQNDASLVVAEENMSCCMDLIGASCVICLCQEE